MKQISEARQKLRTIRKQQVTASKFVLRSLLQWIRKTDQIFFSFGRQSSKSINKLIDDKGKTHTNNDQILKHIAEFYTNLYTEESTDVKAQKKLLYSIQRRLRSDICSDTLEGEIDIDECCEAISRIESQKSPRADGLPAEFYIMFWDVLGRDLVEVINYADNQSLLPKSMCSSIVTLAFKGKYVQNQNDRFCLQNWRPLFCEMLFSK